MTVMFNSGVMQIGIVARGAPPEAVANVIGAWTKQQFNNRAVYSAPADRGQRVWLTLDGSNRVVSAGVNDYQDVVSRTPTGKTLYCGESLQQQDIAPTYRVGEGFAWRSGTVSMVCRAFDRFQSTRTYGPSYGATLTMIEGGIASVNQKGSGRTVMQFEQASAYTNRVVGSTVRYSAACGVNGCTLQRYEGGNTVSYLKLATFANGSISLAETSQTKSVRGTGVECNAE